MGVPWTPGEDIWRFRSWVRHGRRGFALGLGCASAFFVMWLFNNHYIGWLGWFFAAILAIGIGSWWMWFLFRWAEKPALVVSWNGLSWGSLQAVIPWSEVSDLEGEGPVFVLTRSGTKYRCPWFGLAPIDRPQLSGHLRKRLEAWGGRGPLTLPPARWTMQTARLALRPWQKSDVKRFHRVYSDGALLAYQDYPALTPGEARRRLGDITRVEDRPEAFAWTRAIVCRDSARVVGHLDVWISGVSMGVAQFGYGIFPENQGRGLMTEVVAEFAPLVIERWGAQRLEARVKTHNERSKSVLRKSGFTQYASKSTGDTEVWVYGVDATGHRTHFRTDSS